MPPRVLLAQNSNFDRTETELALQSLGWEILVATSAKQACELVKQQEFQFVLLALVFEDGDGYSVARAIREIEGTARKALIVATGKGGVTEDETCVQAGMDGVINLDCDREEITGQLQKWIARLAFRMWKTEGMPRLTLDRMWTGNNST